MPTWTEEETQWLIRRRKEEATLKTISRELHKGLKAVGEKVRRLGLAQPWAESILDLSHLSETELAYIAGFWDADGCFALIKGADGRMAPRVEVANTAKAIHAYLEDRLTTGVTMTEHRPSPRHKTAHKYRVNRMADVVGLVDALLPYLVIKTERATLVREWCVLRMSLPSRMMHDPREEEIYQRLKVLNRKGPPP